MPSSVQQSLPFFEAADSTPAFGSESHAGLTEIVLSHPPASQQPYALVLPMLAHLSQAYPERWFTWIAPKGICKALLASYGFRLKNVRLVYPKATKDIVSLYWEALNNGTSATVVAIVGSLAEPEFANLESAARKGNSQGLLLRVR